MDRHLSIAAGALAALLSLSCSAVAQLAVSANEGKVAGRRRRQHGAAEPAARSHHAYRSRRFAAQGGRRAQCSDQRRRAGDQRRRGAGRKLCAGDLRHQDRSGGSEEGGAQRSAFGDRSQIVAAQGAGDFAGRAWRLRRIDQPCRYAGPRCQSSGGHGLGVLDLRQQRDRRGQARSGQRKIQSLPRRLQFRRSHRAGHA